MNEGENLLAKGKNKPAMVAFKRAVTELGKALRIKPNSPEIHYALGVSYQRLAKTNQAVKEWEKTLKLQPQHPGALFNMGSIAHKKMHTSEAIYYWCSFLSIAGRNYPSQRQLILKKFRADGLQCPN